MKYLLCFFLLIFLSCSDDDNKHEILSFEELCSYIPSAQSTENCDGAFLVHIREKQGKMDYSDELGYYYVRLSVENTYDCSILGIICQGDYANLVGSEVRVSADIHEYALDHQAAIAGQILVSLMRVTID